MTAPILLTGGTGTLGRVVVPLLRQAGHDVRVLSRRDHEDGDVEYVTGDLATGTGVERAVAGVETIVHCAGGAKGDGDKARTLMAAAPAGVRHVVYISVVGADRVPVVSRADRAMFGYYAEKAAGERAVAESGIPWTTVRATQFHELTLTTARLLSRMPIVPVMSGFRFQPVDAGEVAARLAELALGAPAGLVPDFGGPRVYSMKELVRGYLAATGRRRLIVPARAPGRAARAMRDGANLTPDRPVGRRTWEDFLAQHVAGAGADADAVSH
ncbi:SDR family oxidoreductase [Jiangella asiatica]|uniref:NAD-dependent epimerase/dehydratase family protein n=1 Tax=Jiangella asiatica TaxID=2530372 RepID=A0A4R5CIF5_9ACTN|nr:NAD(P)H-binding protein [Jiangella asiatica]TDD97114.1 NAD-dependent epimerase/dehydratase family protein [Jiangella asiatica]